MKRIIALLIILPAATLAGCANHSKSIRSNYYECHKIISEIYDAPHRYKTTGRNKLLATTDARLQKEYRHYDCSRYNDSFSSQK